MTKKIQIYILVFVFLTFGYIQQSKAILPLVYGAVMAAVDATAELTVAQNIGTALIGIGSAALIGQRLGVLSLRSSDGAGNDMQIRIPLTSDNRDRPISNPTLPASKTLPPLAIYQCPANTSGTSECASYGTCTYPWTRTYGSPNYTTHTCTAHTVNGLPSVYPNQYGVVGGNSYDSPNMPMDYVCDPAIATGSPYGAGCQLKAGANRCGAGYSLNGSNCTLTAPQAVPDKKIGFTNIGGDFAPDTTDGDYDPALQSSNFSYSAAAIAFKVAHPDYVDGYPPGYWQTHSDAPTLNVQVTDSMASGGSVAGACPYQVCIPVPGLPGHYRIAALSNNKTTGMGQAVAIDVNKTTGIVDAVNVVPLNGQLLQAGSTYINTAGQTVTVPAGSVVVAQPVAGTYAQSTTNNVTNNYTQTVDTTNLAKTGEAAVAAKTITDDLELTGDTTDLAEPALTNPLISYFNPLRSWVPPSFVGTCPVSSWTWLGTTYSFAIICQLFENNLTLIQGISHMLAVISALFIVLGA